MAKQALEVRDGAEGFEEVELTEIDLDELDDVVAGDYCAP
jgi:hypothetical protein